VARVARYCVLVGCGGGLIEERDVSKTVLAGAEGGKDSHPRPALRAASELLRETLGLELVRCLAAPTQQQLLDRRSEGELPDIVRLPSWALRRLPPSGPATAEELEEGAHAAAAAVDGLSAAQRGLLGVVLSLLLLEPGKVMREDRLWGALARFDSDRFAARGGMQSGERRGAARRGAARRGAARARAPRASAALPSCPPSPHRLCRRVGAGRL